MNKSNKHLAFTAAIALVAALGIIDWRTGYEFQFFVFYFIPVTLAARVCTPMQAYATAVASALVWLTADAASGTPYTNSVFILWNTVARLIAFLLIAFFMVRNRAFLVAARRESSELRRALEEVRELKGLLPLCSRCRKLRDDKGYWKSLEEYIVTHTGARVTHALCDDCARATLREAGIEEGLIQRSIGSGATSGPGLPVRKP